MRRVAGVIAGLVIAFVIVQGAEMFVHRIHPFPAGMNERDMTQIKAFVATLPTDAFILVLFGWLVGTLARTFAAAKIGRSAIPGYIVGALLLIAGIFNAIVIPQPIWFSLVSLVIYIGATLLGVRLAVIPRVEQVPA